MRWDENFTDVFCLFPLKNHQNLYDFHVLVDDFHGLVDDLFLFGERTMEKVVWGGPVSLKKEPFFWLLFF